MKIGTRKLVETAILVALATVLSIFKIDMPMGGGLTICSMLPIVLLSFRWKWKWGVLSAFVYSLLQLVLGLDNVGYAAAGGIAMVIGCILLDYVVAYLVIGFAGIFDGPEKDHRRAMIIGIVVTFVLRFLCHFITGVWIWNALWPNEYGMAALPYSAVYNGWYMGAELLVTLIVAMIIYAPLKKYITGEDLRKA
ncbi:MAG: energy-coupled thiamine transporter ThiT [Oscillospiraceae bacterium]|nr:energy-coupled thiamine transporter ThiT [Oscillospiraceae bacterium]